MSSYLISFGLANPEHQIDQARVYEFMSQAHGMDSDEQRRLKALYRASGIKSRYSVIRDYMHENPEDWEFYPNNRNLTPFPSTKDRHELYRQHAIKLSKQSSEQAISKTNLSGSDFTHLITISCTGMYAPGLDLDLVKELGLPTTIERTCINFMGCYAAFNGIKLGNTICQANPNAKVLIVATELCTIHFQKGKNEDNLIANAIFGDGSAAVIISGNRAYAKKDITLSPKKFLNDIYPEGSSEMAWNIGNFGFEMKLSSYVPKLIENGISNLVERLLQNTEENLPQHYAFHPGGKKILEVIESELKLSKEQDWAGRKVLQEYGNMSSPTILFVMSRILDELNEDHKGQQMLSLAFGPGLTMESMLLEVS